MNSFKRFGAVVASAAAALVLSAGAASAHPDPDVVDLDVSDLVHDITVAVPIGIVIQDNVLALLGVASGQE